MRKLSKKISMLMVLAMLVSLFSGVVSASAASAWSYKSTNGKFDVARNETIIMEKNEYADFDLYKEGEKVTKAAYTVVWESSDPDVVWVDATNGRLRADKFGKAEAGDKAMISANITNVETGVKAIRSFYIEIAADPVVEEPEVEYAITTKVGDAVLGAETLVAGSEYALVSTVTADGEAAEATVTYTVGGKEVTALKFAAAGEYTVVATATIDNEVVATAESKVVVVKKEAAIVAVEQIKLNTLKVIFNDAEYAKNVLAATDIEDVLELTFNADKVDVQGTERVDHELYYVKAVEDDANAVIVEAYKPLAEGLTYKMAYLENDKIVAYNWIVGTGSIPADIEVAEVGYVIDEYKNLQYVVYNKEGVEITAWYDKDIYPIEWELVSDQTADFDVQTIDGQICFMKKGATAELKVTLDKGFEDDGTELADLVDKGVVYGIDKRDMTELEAYQIYSGGAPVWNGWKSSTDPFNFYIGEGDSEALKLAARYTKTTKDGTKVSWAPINIIEGIAEGDLDNDKVYTYQSSNTDIVAVDETLGYVYPVAVGTARVYIKEDGLVIGYATVKVHEAPRFTSFSVGVRGSDKLSVIADEAGMDEQKLEFTISATDQLGRSLIGDTNLTINFELEKDLADLTDRTVTYGLFDLFDADKWEYTQQWYGWAGNIAADQNGPLAINAGEVVLKQGVAKTIKVKATAIYTYDDGTEKKMFGSFNFQVKYPNVDKTTGPQLVIDHIDTTLGVNDVKTINHGNYDGSVKVVEKDLQGFFVRKLPIDVVAETNDVEARAVSDGLYTVTITKGDYALDSKYVKVAPKISQTDAYTIYVDGLWADGDNVITKADKGNYKVRLYVGNDTKAVSKDADTLKITDSTPAITSIKVAEKITDWESIEGLCDALKFKRGDKELDMKKYAELVNVEWDYKHDDTDRIYIYKVKFLLNVDAYYGDFADGYYTLEEVNVNKTFTIAY